jgi:hypothetical protein
MHPTLESLFDLHVAAAYDKQEFLRSLVGDRAWGYHVGGGSADFGAGRCWRAQILGTESVEEGTWSWAWGSRTGRVPGELLIAAEKMRRIGFEMGLPQFTRPQVPLEEMNGETAGILASGVLGGNAYARGEFDGGAMYVLIDDANYPPHIVDPMQRVGERFPRLIRKFSCHHRRALRGYLQYYNLAWREEELRIIAEGSNGVIEARFDYLGRMKEFARPVDVDRTWGHQWTGREQFGQSGYDVA